MKLLKCIFLILIISNQTVLAQATDAYEKMGMQAWMKGDFKNAVINLEKADANEVNNPNVLRALGYSYFQIGEFDKSIGTYSKLLAVKPNDYSAYYYRGKARLNLANSPKQNQVSLRESFYTSAIKDFTKAIEINGEEDIQILQNRGIALKDYAIFKSYSIKRSVDKTACVGLFNQSIADFQKVLVTQPLRKDIVDLVDYVKAQIASLK